jgi:hypothetical protein
MTHKKVNPSLGGITMNITSQSFQTCPTLGQHKTQLNKTFHAILILKYYSNHVEFETSIRFSKN